LLPSCMSCSFSLFLRSDVDHRYLPSFPTRRSSDLPLQLYYLMSLGITKQEAADLLGQLKQRGLRLHRLRRLKESGLHRRVLSGRSEEHTSELQSRENLVCRLLLEKKKTHGTAPATH